MAQSKILVDTNTYLKLAKTIRPLLFAPFGDDENCLYILPELNDELYIAYAQELDIPLVTDDQDMTALAREYDVSVSQ